VLSLQGRGLVASSIAPDGRIPHPGDPVSALTAIIAVVHVLVSLTLIVLVLLHSGKGGGLSDMFGGGLGATAAGSTVVEKNLDRLTVFAALIFGMSTFGLALTL
jgi:preprotein translocase subunit SecG